MSDTESTGRRGLGEGVQRVSTEEPAVGLVATTDNGPAVAAAILRAHGHGHQAIVAADQESHPEAATFARQLGAVVVHPGELESTDTTRRECLVEAARKRGFPGVIVQADATTRIDVGASVEALHDSAEYAVAAKRAPVVGTRPDILVAIPSYNEEGTIADVVSEAQEHADEVIVVDDGSTDDTVGEALAAGATVIEHEENMGYGGALKTAFEEAERSGASHLVILDGDGQHDPSDVPKLVEEQEASDADIVIGGRFAADSETDLPLYRRFGLKIVNVMTNLSMGVVRKRSRVSDTQSGFRAYNRQAITTLAEDDSIGDDMGASTDILNHAHLEGYDIEEVGTTITYDVEEPCSQSPWSHGIHLVMNILQTVEEQRPIMLLGVPGFVSTLIGLSFGYFTFANYIDTGTFPLGLAIVSVFFGLAGIFSCFTAIILHSLKQHFE